MKFLKIPTDMAIFALRSQKVQKVHKVPKVCSYVASQFIYPGKAKISDKPQNVLADLLDINPRTVYRHFDWLLDRNWMGKDEANGWYFFRSLDHLRKIENWKHNRAAVMVPLDLQNFKEFLIGAVISSIIKTGRGTGTDRKRKRSEQPGFPVSLSLIKHVIGVSRRTAISYVDMAKRAGYIYKRPNLRQITGITAKDIRLLKQNDVDRLKVNLFGSSDSLKVKPQQLRTDKGYVYAQLANLITPNVQLRKR